MVRPSFALALALAAVSFAGCGDGADGTDTSASTPRSTATTTTPATGTTPTATTPQGAIDTMSGASTRPVRVRAPNRRTALLTDVRAARHDGFDRVVFQFQEILPGYDIRYVSRPVRQDGSGKVVPVAGNHVVQIRMENALDADLGQASAPPTYTGPPRFRPGTPEVVELARAGGFEGVLTWVAGLQDRADFRVTTLTAPARLIVDFRNH